MTEQIIHSILLALHNIALVGCAAAPFYNRALVLKRSQFGPKLNFELDKVVEDTLQGNAPYCIVFIITLFITGMGMPLNHYLFHLSFKSLHFIAYGALAIKLLFVFGMFGIEEHSCLDDLPSEVELGKFQDHFQIDTAHI